MAESLEIDKALLKGLKPILKEDGQLEDLHEKAAKFNPIAHLTHLSLMAGLEVHTNYNDAILNAANVGATAYEALGVHTGEPVSTQFAIDVIASRAKNPNFGLELAEHLAIYRIGVTLRYPLLAGTLYELCLKKVKDPELALTYGVGSAAVLFATNEEVMALWQVGQEVLAEMTDLQEPGNYS